MVAEPSGSVPELGSGGVGMWINVRRARGLSAYQLGGFIHWRLRVRGGLSRSSPRP
ncbi:hypothetical protein GCM10017771_15720 [Streptomyces capitiformicae]|uniref:Uncharacterized protein n=1 Tax=Streptomyces capitiformicae TaxID=2014920 RepID=A0A919GHL7_9ACTN|nr:hypothetical protein GCM10017771_15720 [Streptomyces capitiformicae]